MKAKKGVRTLSAPINDFVKGYADSKASRFHMPGHKGAGRLGIEQLDITEIKGADYLYDASGIIGQSEAQMTQLYGTAKTCFSAEGSSQCIKTMLGIIRLSTDKQTPTVLAPRNVHKAFIDACILLGFKIVWLYPDTPSPSICCCDISPGQIRTALENDKDIDCCYVTSPDYIGNIADIKTISEICSQAGVPLLVDNAHGAYLKFLDEDAHPITLGADMCCDSAHKTLPCVTGGALLHISENAPEGFAEKAKTVMSMFGSTSPSYLILQSLDLCGDMISSGEFGKLLSQTVSRLDDCKQRLTSLGWKLCGSEKLKLTVRAADCGYDGNQLADILRSFGIEPEYSDSGYTVLMAGVGNTLQDFERLVGAFEKIPVRPPLERELLPLCKAGRVMSVRQAAFGRYKTVSVDSALGKVCALTVTACQPSVPVAVSGEVISEQIIKILKRYSIFEINVLY